MANREASLNGHGELAKGVFIFVSPDVEELLLSAAKTEVELDPKKDIYGVISNHLKNLFLADFKYFDRLKDSDTEALTQEFAKREQATATQTKLIENPKKGRMSFFMWSEDHDFIESIRERQQIWGFENVKAYADYLVREENEKQVGYESLLEESLKA